MSHVTEIRTCALQKQRYLDGIRRYQRKGVKILFDGVERPEHDWDALFSVSENGGFYEGRHVSSPDGLLREIHFDWNIPDGL